MDAHKETPLPARISRVVPGRLIYVELCSSRSVHAVTPDKVEIEDVDGTAHRYRGEAFREIGIRAGASVRAFGDDRNLRKLIVRRLKPSGLSRLRKSIFG